MDASIEYKCGSSTGGLKGYGLGEHSSKTDKVICSQVEDKGGVSSTRKGKKRPRDK